MPQCFVLNCGNHYHKTRRSKGNRIVQYHVFPSDRNLAQIWALRCRGVKTAVPLHTRVCSDHFSPDNYKRDMQHELLGLPLRRMLLPGSIPDTRLPESSVLNANKIIDSAVMNVKSSDKCEDINNVCINSVSSTENTQFNVKMNEKSPAKRVKLNDFIPIIDLTVSPKKTVNHIDLQVTMNNEDTSVDRDISLTPKSELLQPVIRKPPMLIKTPKLLKTRANKINNINKVMPFNLNNTYPPGNIVSGHNLEMNTPSRMELSTGTSSLPGKCLRNKPQKKQSKRNSIPKRLLKKTKPLRSSSRIAIRKSNEIRDAVESPVKDKTKFLMKLHLKRVIPQDDVSEPGTDCNPSEAAATPEYWANKNR